MSYGELLALSLGGFIAFGAGSLPAGWLGDMWSRRNMMAVFFLGIGAATVLTGFAASPAMLAAGLTLIGLFAAIYHPVGTAMLVAHADKIGRTIGVNGVWGNMGVAFAALLTGALTQFFGWRTAFILPGALGIAVGVAFLGLVPDRPAAKRPEAGTARNLPRDVLVRAFAVMAVAAIAGGVTFNATTVSMPKLFDERMVQLVATPAGVGALAAAVFVIGAMSQLVVGWVIDRQPLRAAFLPLAALQAPCLLLAAFASNWALLAAAVGMMFAVFGQATINDAMIARYTTDAWRSRAYAVRYIVSFGASASAVPLVALLHDYTGGFNLTYQVLAVFGLVVFLGAIAFPHRPDEVAPVPAAAE
jgi:MFS family permease